MIKSWNYSCWSVEVSNLPAWGKKLQFSEKVPRTVLRQLLRGYWFVIASKITKDWRRRRMGSESFFKCSYCRSLSWVSNTSSIDRQVAFCLHSLIVTHTKTNKQKRFTLRQRTRQGEWKHLLIKYNVLSSSGAWRNGNVWVRLNSSLCYRQVHLAELKYRYM